MTAKMKKLLALLLALVMVFALAACGNDASNYDDDDDDDDDEKTSQTDDKKDDEEEEKTDADLIVGKWAVATNIGELMNAGIAQSLGDESLSSDVEMLLMMTMEFGEDGEFTFALEADQDSIDDYMADMKQNMLDYMYQMAEDQGTDKEAFEEAFETQYEMTLEEYVDSVLETVVDAMLVSFEGSNISGYYELDSENSLIYVEERKSNLSEDSDYFEYEFDGEMLLIHDMVSEGESVADAMEQLGYEIPWEMERQ